MFNAIATILQFTPKEVGKNICVVFFSFVCSEGPHFLCKQSNVLEKCRLRYASSVVLLRISLFIEVVNLYD